MSRAELPKVQVKLRLHLEKDGDIHQTVTEVNVKATILEEYFGSEENAWMELATEAFQRALRVAFRQFAPQQVVAVDGQVSAPEVYTGV